MFIHANCSYDFYFFVFHKIRITERLALNFQGGVGRQLHEELVTQDTINRDTCYTAGQLLLDQSLDILNGLNNI